MNDLKKLKYLIEKRGLNPMCQIVMDLATDVDQIKYLIEERGMNPDQEVLNIALRQHRLLCVKYLCEVIGMKPNPADCMHIVIYQGPYGDSDCLDLIKYLIEKHGVNPKDVDSDGNNALHYTAISNWVRIENYLIQQCGMDPRCKNKYGRDIYEIHRHR